MTIEIINQNGVVKGIDTETGEEVPIDMGEILPEEIGSEEDRVSEIHSESHTTEDTDTGDLTVNTEADFSDADRAMSPVYEDTDEMADLTDTAGSWGIANGRFSIRTEDT